jgi:hypothetical protein
VNDHTLNVYGDNDALVTEVEISHEQAALIRKAFGCELDEIDPMIVRGVFLQTWAKP